MQRTVELEEAAGYERMGVAQSIWYLYHDISDEAKKSRFFPSLIFMGMDSPKETEWLAEQLNQPQFWKTLRGNIEVLSLHMRQTVLAPFSLSQAGYSGKRLDELNAPLKEFQSEMMYVPLVRRFVTDDEINADMTRGSDFAGGESPYL